MKLLITGATGFVGRALVTEARARGWQLRAAVRRPLAIDGVEPVEIGDIGPDTDWRAAVRGCDAVVHLAARVHRLDRGEAGDLAAFRRVNVAGSERLARQAAEAGVRRLVFVSTVKVHGEGAAQPYRESDAPAPVDPYAISKWEAEQALARVAADTGIELVVLRPPLVYGPDAGANFRRLLRLALKGVPLPLAAIDNRRSLIHVDNLAHAITLCVEHPLAAGQTFLVADGALSTPALVRELAAATGRRARLLPLPPSLLLRLARWCRCEPEAQRLLASLAVDDGALRSRLGWTPPLPQREALRRTAVAMAARMTETNRDGH